MVERLWQTDGVGILFFSSQWDELKEKGFRATWDRLDSLLENRDVAQILNPPHHYHGGTVYHHGLPGGEGSADSYSDTLIWTKMVHEGEMNSETSFGVDTASPNLLNCRSIVNWNEVSLFSRPKPPKL